MKKEDVLYGNCPIVDQKVQVTIFLRGFKGPSDLQPTYSYSGRRCDVDPDGKLYHCIDCPIVKEAQNDKMF